MKSLEEKIVKDGRVLEGNILKVDNFLNHQIDVMFLCEVGKEFKRLYADCGITKVLTIEASGIGVACLTAQYFGVPVLFAKKSRSSNISQGVYSSKVESYTHGKTFDVVVSEQYLNENDRVLIIDDFLATGNALVGLIDIVEQAKATVVGCGIVIEKAYQDGGKLLRDKGYRVESLAKIASMDSEKGIEFC